MSEQTTNVEWKETGILERIADVAVMAGVGVLPDMSHVDVTVVNNSVLNAVSTLKNKLIDVDSFKADADDFFSKTLSRIYARYQHILREHSALDFVRGQSAPAQARRESRSHHFPGNAYPSNFPILPLSR